jgi:glutathione S-transferase
MGGFAMKRVIWGRSTSSNVRKVIWLLDELDLPYERLDVGGEFGKTDTPHYRAMNPTGLVPTLQEGEFTLFESNAILRYLVDAYAPLSPMLPRDLRARANVDRWMDFQQTVINRPQTVVFLQLARTAPEKRDAAALKAATAEAARGWAMVDTQLGKHAYVASDTFSLADICLGVHVHRWLNLPVEGRPDLPNLSRWYDLLLQRPVYVQRCAGPIV